MDASEVTMIRRQAVQRVLLRRRKPAVRIQHGHIEDLTISEVVGTEFTEPTTLDEWIDDQMAVLGQLRGPFVLVLAEVLEAARGSERAALAALTGAKQLAEWDRWHLYADLRLLQGRATLPEARKLTGALTNRWERLRLTDSRPDYSESGELPDPPQPDRYARPVPAGRLPWVAA